MKARKVCILGGTGFVGHYLSNRLAKQGISCRILTRHPQRHRDLEVLAGSEVVAADVFDQQILRRQLTGCDAVINLVGILNERGSGETFRHLHVELVELIVEAARDAGVGRFLHMSALNADATNGKSEYLRSKGEGENRAHTLGQAAMQVSSFRPSVIFGPGDSFFNRFAALLKLSPGILPLACPQTRFAPVYVGDVVEAMVGALENPSTWDRHYDLCGPRVYTLHELVGYTAKTLNLKRLVLELNDLTSRMQARLFQYLPGKPFTIDNYLSLQSDNVCQNNGLLSLGISPIAIEAVVPYYLK